MYKKAQISLDEETTGKDPTREVLGQWLASTTGCTNEQMIPSPQIQVF